MRCTGAGFVFGFPHRSLRLRFFGFQRSLALVRPPGDLGRYTHWIKQNGITHFGCEGKGD
jgi:hypothetical protein